jgi:dienelactone hydrolase
MNIKLKWLLPALLFSLLLLAAANLFQPADDKEFHYELHETAKFKLLIPGGVTFVRGVIGVSDYFRGANIYGAQLGYRKLAKKLEFAVLKYYLGKAPGMLKKERYNDVVSALDYFSVQTGHRELKYSKLVLTGLSYGGRQACLFALHNPSRCIAIIVLHGAFNKKYGGSLDFNGAAREIPALFPIARFDEITGDSAYHEAMNQRKKNAPWAAYIDPNTSHEEVKNQGLNIMWLEAAVERRLPGHIPAEGDFQLHPIQQENGWLGFLEYDLKNNKSIVTKVEIYPYGKYPYDRSQAHWLPNRQVAGAWLERNLEGSIKK